MTVDPATAAGQYDYEGVTYYFCATSCLETFKRDPQRALQARQPALITLGKKQPLPMMPESASAESGHIDPVGGMTVQPECAAGSFVHKGKRYYFCYPCFLAWFCETPALYLIRPAAPPQDTIASPAS
jgi:Cu+-exporting ATPase